MVAAKRLQLGCSHKAEDSCGFLVFLAVPRAQPIWILWNTQPLSEVHGKSDKTVGWKKGKRKKSATNVSLEFVQVKSNEQSQTSTEIFWCWIQLYFKGRGLRAPGTTYIQVSHGCRGPTAWATCCCFPRRVARELDLKLSSQDLNRLHGGRWQLHCQYHKTCLSVHLYRFLAHPVACMLPSGISGSKAIKLLKDFHLAPSECWLCHSSFSFWLLEIFFFL